MPVLPIRLAGEFTPCCGGAIRRGSDTALSQHTIGALLPLDEHIGGIITRLGFPPMDISAWWPAFNASASYSSHPACP